jgi:hypothetical protein
MKSAIRKMLRRMGLEFGLVRTVQFSQLQLRWGPAIRTTSSPKALPPTFDSYEEAMYYQRGGKPATFPCPVGSCVDVNGLNFNPRGWHPFTAALEEMLMGRSSAYAGSVLERFYSTWRPANARDALIDAAAAPPKFAEFPPHMIYLFPWSSRTAEEAEQAVRTNMYNDNIQHGHPELNGGDTLPLKHHGPVPPAMGEFEYGRLRKLLDSIATHGYSPDKGGAVRVLALRRGDDMRFLSFGGGLHRTAVMRALGQDRVPATLQQPWILDADEIGKWPQVRGGDWDLRSARAYIDHLFDFDARGWAASLGLSHQD